MNNSLFYNEKPIISGSSKDFYETNDPNIFKVIFKDVIHGRGREDTIKGTGRLREEFCYYFYKLLEKEGIKVVDYRVNLTIYRFNYERNKNN